MKKKTTYSTARRRPKGRKKLPIVLLVVIVLAGILAALEATNTTHFFHKDTLKPVAEAPGTVDKGVYGSSSDSQQPTTSTSSPSNGSKQNPSTSTSTPTTSSGAAPKTPYGNFVSNHSPGKDGSPLTEESACNTTPSATCTISFTNNGVTKSLPTKTTDTNGVAIWDWKLSDIGLTTGSWKITASANLNGQTVSGSDTIPLEVQ